MLECSDAHHGTTSDEGVGWKHHMVPFLKPMPYSSWTSFEQDSGRRKRCSEVLRLAESVVQQSKSIVAMSKALVLESRILLEQTSRRTLC